MRVFVRACFMGAVILVCAAVACRQEGASSSASASAARTGGAKSSFELHSIILPNDGKSGGEVKFTSKFASGSIVFAPEIRVEYELQVEGAGAKRPGQTTILRVSRDRVRFEELQFDGPELLVGVRSFGRLEDKVAIKIGADGVFVNEEKRGDL